MILCVGISGVKFGMLNMYPKHIIKLNFKLYFRIISTWKNVHFSVNITCILFQVQLKDCYIAICPNKTEPRALSFYVLTQQVIF